MAKNNRDAFEVLLEANELGYSGSVGTLYRDKGRTALPPSFEYTADWIAQQPFMLDPRLALYAGEQHPVGDSFTFGIFLDSAPDRWGRVLMERREAIQAKKEGRDRRTLQEMDFLLGVNDHTRQGALRFRRPDGPFLDNSELPTPTVTDLNELASICNRLEEDGVEELPEYEKWLSLLIAPGSSLGGARPKANFEEADNSLWIAKFPAKNDIYDVGAWELVTHRLAEKAKICVPPSRATQLASKYHTFCVKRFDRTGTSRRMYASAMTLLEKKDGEFSSYLDMAEFISKHGASGSIQTDLTQLFRRVLFNVLVSNRDDHLRNHGFIRITDGWRLSDAFDMNPNLNKAHHALALDDTNPEPDIAIAMSTAEFYRLTNSEALDILKEVVDAISGWAQVAKSEGLSAAEIDRMKPAFQI
ncbi:type II toxin-antitoxin system HipA family toxin [Sulfuriferula nivalis]|uniref:Toxin HipA n=1 Tax=Sulfuriferula nivalis TaxID=2675298 RepID=A0A809RD72_9PROT|nr:type II toxin-antitoxin system HipA family toxin [Sulfuriferula nivalis]BBO99718.1 toxin HipA [Sulfuriferula nivalis]